MTKPEPLDCAWPFAVRFTIVTTAGNRSRTTSTIVSLPATTLIGAVVGMADGAALTCTSSSGARPVMTVAAAPPTTPPRITPRRRMAALFGPDARGAGPGESTILGGLPPRSCCGFGARRDGLAAARGRARHLGL